MGWAGAVSIFDKVVTTTKDYIPDDKKSEVYWEIFEELRYGDWDTVSESDYFYADWMLPILRQDGYFSEYYTEEEYLEERDDEQAGT
jgi:hypothetical protein